MGKGGGRGDHVVDGERSVTTDNENVEEGVAQREEGTERTI